MGTNGAPLVADLFLFCYEKDFLMSLSEEKQSEVIEAFSSMSRYFNDLLLNPSPPTPPVVYSTDRSKAVVPVLILFFVALWFMLRGDLFYVLPCFILFLWFSVLLALRLPRLGKRELILVLFVHLCSICACLVLSVSSSSWCLGLWYSLDFSLTFFWQWLLRGFDQMYATEF